MNELNQKKPCTHTHKERERVGQEKKNNIPTIYSISNVVIIIHLYRVILPNVFNQINASLAFYLVSGWWLLLNLLAGGIHLLLLILCVRLCCYSCCCSCRCFQIDLFTKIVIGTCESHK